MGYIAKSICLCSVNVTIQQHQWQWDKNCFIELLDIVVIWICSTCAPTLVWRTPPPLTQYNDCPSIGTQPADLNPHTIRASFLFPCIPASERSREWPKGENMSVFSESIVKNSVVDPNPLCSDSEPNPCSHVHSGPAPAPKRIRINSDPALI